MNLGLELKRRGMTATDLATRIGVTTATITRLSNGNAAGIQFNRLEDICRALECTPNDLFFSGDRSFTEIARS